MGLFNIKENIRVIYLKENFTIKSMFIPLDDMSSEIITKMKNGKREFSWFLIQQLLKPVYGFPGIPDGSRALLVCSKDVRYDPLQQLDASWSKENIKKKMVQVAKEQQHKVEKSSAMGILSRSTMLLSVSVIILIIAIAVIGVIKFRSGA